MNRAGQIQKRLLADLVFDRLLLSILTGERAPGDRLMVDELAEEYGISRTPVREALSRLAWERFVDANRNTLSRVAEWAPSDMADRLDMLGRLLGPLVARAPVETGDLVGDLASSDAPAADVEIFLEWVARLVESSAPVEAHTITNLLRPLSVFYSAEVLESHSADLETAAPRRRCLLVTIFAGPDAGAVAGYLTELADATRLVQIGSDLRA